MSKDSIPIWLKDISFDRENKTLEIKIESGREVEFYNSLGLELNDDDGLNKILTEELQKFIEEKRNESGT